MMQSKKSQKSNYECLYCNYITKNKRDFNKHCLTNKHKFNIGEIKKIPKLFSCNYCNKSFNNNTSLWRHKKICNKNICESPKVSKSLQKVSSIFLCKCGKNYKSKSGFYKHKKLCNISLQHESNDSSILNEIIPTNNVEKLLKNILDENKILREEIKKLKLGNTMFNTNNNQFNINMFLNEKCKNAMNLEDFIQKIKFTLEDLQYTRDNGYTKGISNVFIKSLNDMDVTERPIHCSDQKRLHFYVKNDDEWTRDNNNEKIDSSIEKISKKQIETIKKWTEQNPDFMDCDQKRDEYFKLVTETMKPNDDKNLRNIKKKVGENVKLDK